MSGTVVFQSNTPATPGAGIVVGQDDVSGTAFQFVKIDVGPAGTSRPVSYAGGTGVPVSGLGTFQVLGSIQTVGTSQALGTFQSFGTNQALGTYQPLAGSVHLASGTVQVLGSIQGVGTFQVLGSVQTVGTSQALGTVQPLAGSVHLASTGTLPLGTVQVLGSVQGVGTFQVLGTVQAFGTTQVLGSVQPLAGSVQGFGAVATPPAGNPFLIAAYGSSGTQAASGNGSAVYLWADPNGRLQVRGTVDTVLGTVQVLGSIQGVGTFQVLGSIQSVGTNQALGTFQAFGTAQVLGTHQAAGTTLTKEVRSTAPTTSFVAGTIGNVILLAANPARLGAAVYLEGGQPLFLKLGSNAGTLDYTLQMATGGYYEVPFNYAGTISGIWQVAGGTARVTEIA